MLNQVNLIGRLGGDPEISYTAGGTAVAKFSLATSEKRNGEQITEWHNIVFFNKMAEVATQYLKKGGLAHVTGKIKYTHYDKSDGTKGFKCEILCHGLVMLNSAQGGDNSHAAKSEKTTGSKSSYDKNAQVAQPEFDDDIPF